MSGSDSDDDAAALAEMKALQKATSERIKKERPPKEKIAQPAKAKKPKDADVPRDLVGKNCLGCSKEPSGMMLKACGGIWHKKCLKCSTCGVPVTEQGELFDVLNVPYCKKHYKAATTAITDVKSYLKKSKSKPSVADSPKPKKKEPESSESAVPPSDVKCKKCGEAASGKMLKALGAVFHAKCLVCEQCGIRVDGPGQLFEVLERPFCKDHVKTGISAITNVKDYLKKSKDKK